MDASTSWETMYDDEKYDWFWPPAHDPKSSRKVLEAMISYLAVRANTRLLDLACGRGWLTIPLAQRGFQVTGLDLSKTLLSRAEYAANQEGVQIEWIRGDMRDLPDEWAESYESVTLTLSEFGCFDDNSDNQSVLEEVARVLKSGGRFLLDIVVNRDGLVVRGATHGCLEGNGFFVSERGSFDLLTGIHKRDYRWYDGGECHRAKWRIRAYTPPEVVGMLERAGMQVLASYGNLAGDELRRDSTGMMFVAQKKV